MTQKEGGGFGKIADLVVKFRKGRKGKRPSRMGVLEEQGGRSPITMRWEGIIRQ